MNSTLEGLAVKRPTKAEYMAFNFTLWGLDASNMNYKTIFAEESEMHVHWRETYQSRTNIDHSLTTFTGNIKDLKQKRRLMADWL